MYERSLFLNTIDEWKNKVFLIKIYAATQKNGSAIDQK